MKKLLIVVMIICLSAIVLSFIFSPKPEIIIETIKPQIISYISK